MGLAAHFMATGEAQLAVRVKVRSPHGLAAHFMATC